MMSVRRSQKWNAIHHHHHHRPLIPLCGVGTTCFLLPFSSITRHLHAHSSYFHVIFHTIHPIFSRPTSSRVPSTFKWKCNAINVINFQKWCSLFSKSYHYVALFQELFDTPVNGRPSLFRIDSVRWRLLFPTLCWSNNTNSMPETLSIKRNRIKIRWVVLKI
jgi:hypothetical protein